MTYLSIHDFFKDISENLGFSVKWFHGPRSVQNLTTNDDNFYFFSLPFTAPFTLTDNTRQVNATWQAVIYITQQDQPDSDLDQNNQDEMQASARIVSMCESIAQKFLHYINENTITDALSDSADEITITGGSITPVYRDISIQHTGVQLIVNFTVSDTLIIAVILLLELTLPPSQTLSILTTARL